MDRFKWLLLSPLQLGFGANFYGRSNVNSVTKLIIFSSRIVETFYQRFWEKLFLSINKSIFSKGCRRKIFKILFHTKFWSKLVVNLILNCYNDLVKFFVLRFTQSFDALHIFKTCQCIIFFLIISKEFHECWKRFARTVWFFSWLHFTSIIVWR